MVGFGLGLGIGIGLPMVMSKYTVVVTGASVGSDLGMNCLKKSMFLTSPPRNLCVTAPRGATTSAEALLVRRQTKSITRRSEINEMMTHFVTEMRRSVESEAQPQRMEVNDRVNDAVSCREE